MLESAPRRSARALLRSRFLYVLVIAILVGFTTSSVAADPIRLWQPLSPGNVYAVASYRDLGGQIFAGTTNGVWRSGNGGNTWQWTGPGPIGPVGSLAVDPNDRQTVYAGTGLTRYDGVRGTGLYRSRDGGTTWQHLPGIPDGDVTDIHLQGLENAKLWAGTSAGLYQSTDGGASWSLAPTPFGSAGVLAIAQSAASTLYVATSQGLYRTDDDGITWSERTISQLPDGIVQVLATDPSRPSVLYAHVQHLSTACLLKTVDGGATWARIGAALPCGNATLVRAILVDPNAPDTVYLGTDGFGVYVSKDGGVNWQQSAGLGGLGPTRDGNVVNTLAPAYRGLLAGVGVGNSSGSGVFQSFDFGADWSALMPLAGASVPIVAPDPFDREVISTVAHGRIYWTEDGGESWQTSTGIPTPSVVQLVADPYVRGRLYAGSSQYGVYVSTDGGRSWVRSNAGMSFSANDIQALVVDPVRSGILYAGTLQDGLYRSSDSARSWSSVPLPVQTPDDWSIRVIAIDRETPDTVYVATEAGRIFRSTDDGRSWQIPNSSSIRANAIAVVPGSPSTLLVATETGLYQSNDGGAEYLPVPGVDTHVNAIFVSPTTSTTRSATIFLAVGAAGADGAVLRSDDDGKTWQDAGLDIPGMGPALTVQVSPTDADEIQVGTGGGSLWGYTLGRASSTELGPAGGSITSVDGYATLEIPAGALDATTLYTMTTALPEGFVDGSRRSIGKLYQVTAGRAGQAVDGLPAGAQLVFTFSEGDRGPSNRAGLQLARYALPDQAWLTVNGSTVDPDQNRVSAPVTQVGWYALLGPHPAYRSFLTLVLRSWPAGW